METLLILSSLWRATFSVILIYLLRRMILNHSRFQVTLHKRNKHQRAAAQRRETILSQVWSGFRKMKNKIVTWEMKHSRDSLPNRVHLALRILFSFHVQITSRTCWDLFITPRICKAKGSFSQILTRSRNSSHNQFKLPNSHHSQLR